jgi:hypothetical protein
VFRTFHYGLFFVTAVADTAFNHEFPAHLTIIPDFLLRSAWFRSGKKWKGIGKDAILREEGEKTMAGRIPKEPVMKASRWEMFSLLHAPGFRWAWATSALSLLVLSGCASAPSVPPIRQVPAAVQGQYRYTTDSGTITIMGFIGSGSVTIPDTINGLPVTSIGDAAFLRCTSLTSITIPNSVASIGVRAFKDCTNLTSVMIPNSVTDIGHGAFFGCHGLTNVTIPNSVTIIRNDAFRSCTSLTNVTIPNRVTSIGSGAFHNCASLTSVTIPNSVTTIRDSAFLRCTSLTKVTIGSGVTYITSSMFSDCFSGCTNLTSVTIPNTVTDIGYGAFSSFTSLTNVMVDALNSAYSSFDGVLFNKSQSMLILCPPAKAGSFTIPNRVTIIGDEAFQFCASLTNVTMCNNVTSIGNYAFRACTSLTSVMIGNSVTNIGDAAFYFCTSLNTIAVDALNSNYASLDGVLFNKSKTTIVQCPGGKTGSYTVPNSVTSIGASAFQNCTGLTNLTIADIVSSIGDAAFQFCNNLTNVTIGNSVTNIGVGAFQSCNSLTSVTIGNSVTSIGTAAFAFCNSLARVYFKGNKPGIDGFVFRVDRNAKHNATVYYLPGTQGWRRTFDGCPTALWKP